MGGKPKAPQLPPAVESPTVIEGDEKEVKRRKRVSVANTGRTQNILSGLQAALKQRLGE